MHSLNKKSLQSLVQEFALDENKIWQLEHYVTLLEEWSSRTNLVSKNDVLRLVSKHIYESLEIERHALIHGQGRALDLGSGAGFPGVPLAVLKPQVLFTLLDSRRIKTLFLQEVVDVCQLTTVNVVKGRVEDYYVSPNKRFDFVLSRAVASLDVLWGWSSRLLCQGGQLIAFKGGNVQEEIEALSAGNSVRVKSFPFCGQDNPGYEQKCIIVVAFQ